jgi:hypothetical protein
VSVSALESNISVCEGLAIGQAFAFDTIIPTQKWANPADAEIRFEDDEMVFGDAVEGDEILAEYIFTNIGADTLEIDIVHACKCIRSEWPKAPILPGESAQITVLFDTLGWSGERKKTVDVIFKNKDFNGYPLVKQLTLKGRIAPK